MRLVRRRFSRVGSPRANIGSALGAGVFCSPLRTLLKPNLRDGSFERWMGRRGPVACSEGSASAVRSRTSNPIRQIDTSKPDDADHAATHVAINAAAKRVMPAKRELTRLEAVGATGKSA
jgi:hypothetical protein